MDTIILENAVYSCNLGITKEERSTKQIISISLRIEYDILKAAKSDSMEDTIDYHRINDELRILFEEKHFILIESVAQEIAERILDKYPTKKVSVFLKKPYAVRNADFGGIQITREK